MFSALRWCQNWCQIRLSIFHFVSKSHENKEKPRQKPWILWLRRQDSICIFATGENYGSHQCLHWLQELSTGQFLCYGFESCTLQTEKRKSHPGWDDFSFSGCGGRTRTYDLRVMSPTSFQLLYSAILRVHSLVPMYCSTAQ